MGKSPTLEKLSIFANVLFFACSLTNMNTRKKDGEKAVPTGISLPRDLIERAKAYAKAKGYGGLSGLTRHLLTTSLAQVAEAAENASKSAKAKSNKEVKRGFKKAARRQ